MFRKSNSFFLTQRLVRVAAGLPWLRELLPGLLLASVLVLGTSGCNSNPGPPVALTVLTATDLGTVPTNGDILGRDGAHSALFQGYSVWLYDDTFLARANAEDRKLISDSWSFTQDLTIQNGIGGFQDPLDSAGAPAMILPETTAEQAFNQAHNPNDCQAQPCGARWALWPYSVVADTAGNRALIFYMVVYSATGGYNFQSAGSSVATWQDLQHQPQRPTFNPPLVTGHPDLMFSQDEPSFGSAAFINGGTLYVYGCGTLSSASDKGCRLARVAPANVQNRGAWSFYSGNGNWSSKLGDAVSVFTGDDIVSVSWNSFLQRYVAVYSKLFSQDVMMRTSPYPEGPWSAELTAFTAKQPAQGNVYDAHSHPEYDVNGGQTIYVTYSRSLSAPSSSEVRLVAVELQSR